jgi:hypothetical protein
MAGLFSWWRRTTSRTDRRPRQLARSRVRTAAFETLEPRRQMAFTYHGGALLPHVEAQSVFMGNSWRVTDQNLSEARQLNRFVTYLVDSPYMDMLTAAGYNVGRGSAVKSAIGSDVNSGVRDIDLQFKLQSLISTGRVAAPTPNRLYIMFIEPGVSTRLEGDTSADGSFLGYHGAFAGFNRAGQHADIRYAVLPHPGFPNPSAGSLGYANAVDDLTSTTSHEIAEAATDPDVAYKRLGWYDDRRDGEIADFTYGEVRLGGWLVQKVQNKQGTNISPLQMAVASTMTQNRKKEQTAMEVTVVAVEMVP